MDFDGNHLSSMQHALCNVVDYGEVPVGSMMALMTEHEQETEDHLMTSSAVRGTFAYYDHQTEPYLQAALFQAAQAFQIDKVEPQASGPQFSMEQYDSANVVLADSTLSSGKPEVGGKFVNHQDIGSRKECYTEPSHIISPASSMTVQDARVGATSLDVESACTNKVSEAESMRSKILSHPHYPRLVAAYMNCQKVGAPPEIVAKLEELNKDYQNFQPLRTSIIIGADPELDQFMDAYCHMLQKYHEELTRPFKEAMAFFRKIELQLNNLSKGSLKLPQPGEGDDKVDANASSEEDDAGCGEIEFSDVDPLAEDTKLKEQLLRKYSGYICTLKQEFLKKKKKGKLPKEARQKLLDWWNQHYKWPYPSETEKATLAESTGLDQKQINNWFINQRKRHWKPSEDMQYVMVDSPNGHAAIPFADSNIKMESSNIPMDL